MEEDHRWRELQIGVAGIFGMSALWFVWKSQTRKPPRYISKELSGKKIILTGANSGIGKETALNLASKGASLILGVRDPSTIASLKSSVSSETGNENVEIYPLDLTNFESILNFSQKVSSANVLINNAGAMISTSLESKNNLDVDLTMLTNHIGPFYLTELLLPKLMDTASKDNSQSRIVNVNSRLEKKGSLTLTQTGTGISLLKSPLKQYNMFQAYANSKQCNLMFSFELSRRLQRQVQLQSMSSSNPSTPTPHSPSPLVSVIAVSPGLIPTTNLSRHSSFPMRYIGWGMGSLLSSLPRSFTPFLPPILSIEQGAQAIVLAATGPSDSVPTGGFYGPNISSNTPSPSLPMSLSLSPINPSPSSLSEELSSRVWRETKQTIQRLKIQQKEQQQKERVNN